MTVPKMPSLELEPILEFVLQFICGLISDWFRLLCDFVVSLFARFARFYVQLSDEIWMHVQESVQRLANRISEGVA